MDYKDKICLKCNSVAGYKEIGIIWQYVFGLFDFCRTKMLKKVRIKTFVGFFFIVLALQGGCASSGDNFFGYLVNSDIDVSKGISIDDELDEFTDSENVSGNKVRLLIDGPESYDVFTQLIESAQASINIETLNFDDDKDQPENIAMQFVQMLTDKAKSGISVNVILDKASQEMFSDLSIIDKLTAGGVNVKYYRVPRDVKTRFPRFFYHTHKKLLIIDGKKAIVGGMNFGYRYFGENQWRDTNVLLEGPVVASLQRQFARDWEMLGGNIADNEKYFPYLQAVGEISVRTIDQRPCMDDFDINNAVLIALRSAKERVDIESPYFNPCHWLSEAIEQASRRGVKVRILTNSDKSNDIPRSFMISAYNFEEMIEAGVRVFVWNVENRTLHSKVIVVDNSFAMIGSYNFNRRSIMWDAEDAVIFTDESTVGMFEDMLEDDFSSEFAFEITRDWVNSRDESERESWRDWQILNWLF